MITKKRVYELAKELGLENKDLIARMEKLGMKGKSHSSSLEDSEVERIQREFFGANPRESRRSALNPP
jgi:translation initiation factor IF-2